LAARAVLKNAQSPAFVAQTPEAVWWREFDDTELDGLVRRALAAANLDLRSAYDRVRDAADYHAPTTRGLRNRRVR